VSEATAGTARAGNPGCRFAHAVYQTLRCPTGKTPKPSVKTSRRKYSTLPKFGIGVCVAATRPKEEGRIAIVTTRGPDGGGRRLHRREWLFAGQATVSEGLARTTGVTCVRQNRVVLTPGVCASSLAEMCVARPGERISHPRGDGGNSASLPGESAT